MNFRNKMKEIADNNSNAMNRVIGYILKDIEAGANKGEYSIRYYDSDHRCCIGEDDEITLQKIFKMHNVETSLNFDKDEYVNDIMEILKDSPYNLSVTHNKYTLSISWS